MVRSLMNKAVCMLEEFTRFGGGQVVFEYIYKILVSSNRIKVITDNSHEYIPKYIPQDSIVGTKLKVDNWDRVIFLVPKILSLKKELRNVIDCDITVNNHPNVFVYNSTINFVHELFGFMRDPKSVPNKILIRMIKSSGIFREYDNGYFLVQGNFTLRQTMDTFNSIGIKNPKFETIDLPVELPLSVDLSAKIPQVLTFGRISPDKNLEYVIEIARRLPDTRFLIAGRRLPNDKEYLNKLLKEHPPNVFIFENPDESLKDELFRKSMVYLHTKKWENYGLSIAEAISYGLVPVVPVQGGAFEDVLHQGEYGHGYETLDQAIYEITTALSTSISERKRIYESRERFSFERFSDSFITKLSACL